MSKLPLVLLVEDSAPVARTVTRALQRTAKVDHVSSVFEAIDYLDRRANLPPLIVDAKLPDGCGLDVVVHARAREPRLPALAMSGDTTFVNRAYAARVAFVLKPVESKWLLDFVNGAERKKATPHEALMRALDAWSQTHALSPAEHDILVAVVVHGVPRTKLARSLHKAESTVKTQTNNLLSKADKAKGNLEGLRVEVLLDALERR
jgi:FixJ family two-component response regulator